MAINFTGIKDVHIYKKECVGQGFYRDMYDDIKYGKNDYREIVLTARLTDDEDGNHLTRYQEVLPKNYENAKGKDLLRIHLRQFSHIPNDDDIITEVNKEKEFQKSSSIVLNGHDLIIDSKNKLPLMSFIGQMTKFETDKMNLTNGQKPYVKCINKGIHQVAMDYIER